jgi:glycosyltransferase involved in cell wall biosynthesis
MDVSVVIRTFNESRHLPALLGGIEEQCIDGKRMEVIVVDSGSDDATVAIARDRGCRVVEIAKSDFTFGRSLNVGCETAAGRFLVFASGHCIPASESWIANLLRPLENGTAAYTYGRQIGNGSSRFSERQHFRKYFPDQSCVPQDDIFCNNANAALPRSVWQQFRFDESLTGLEDMELANRLVRDGRRIGYVADAPVYHLHEESWHKVRIRYEREAMALQQILPQVHVSFFDFLRYLTSALMLDFGQAVQDRVFIRNVREIFLFRLMQFWGAYRGNHEHRRLSREMKERYFYPK